MKVVKDRECVVNVATGPYVRGQKRLVSALKCVGYAGRVMLWTDELPQGSPAHDDAPMGFKPFAMRAAIEAGYTSILWLDANQVPIRNLSAIFNKIRRHGYYMYSLGSCFGEWCSDLSLNSFGISREKSFELLEINSSCLGLCANHPTALSFLQEWRHYALDSFTFRGIDQALPLNRTNDNADRQVSKDSRVLGHRHDQTVASFLAWKYRFKLSTKEIINYQYPDAGGNNRYAKTIPFMVKLLLSRDTKREDDQYLKSIDRFGNRTGVDRLPFVILSLLSGIRILRRAIVIALIVRSKSYYTGDVRTKAARGNV